MKRALILCTVLLGILTSCAYVPAGDIQDVSVANGLHRYEIIDIVIKDHDYLYFDGYSGENHIIHNPDCKKCQTKKEENNELFSW